MKIRLLFYCLFSSLVFGGKSQTTSYKRQGNSFTFSNATSTLQIDFCNSGMFRVRNSWDKTFVANEPWMVVKYNWNPVNIKVIKGKGVYNLQTSEINVVISAPSFRIEVLDKRNQIISSEQVNAGGNNKSGETVICTKKLFPAEHFFGFGERMDFMDRRGKLLKLNVGRGKGMPHITGAYNILEANYSPIPFFMSTKGYGIFFHTASPTEWDMGASFPD
jgi:hypothetical protein